VDAIAPCGGPSTVYVPRRGQGSGGALAFLQAMASQHPQSRRSTATPNHVTRVLLLRTERPEGEAIPSRPTACELS
jgi:hypothetical protein